MFELFELLNDLDELRSLGLTEEDISGYLEFFEKNYPEIFQNIEVV